METESRGTYSFTEDDMDIIQFVINTLNTVKVSGKEDLQKVLGCILALESLIKDTEEKEKENG